MYYLAIIQNHGESNALFPFSNFEEALARYHTELAYRAAGRTQTVCSILNADGQVLRNEVYNAPVQTPEPTEGEQ